MLINLFGVVATTKPAPQNACENLLSVVATRPSTGTTGGGGLFGFHLAAAGNGLSTEWHMFISFNGGHLL